MHIVYNQQDTVTYDTLKLAYECFTDDVRAKPTDAVNERLREERQPQHCSDHISKQFLFKKQASFMILTLWLRCRSQVFDIGNK